MIVPFSLTRSSPAATRSQRSQTFIVRTAPDARALLSLRTRGRGLHWNIELDIPALQDAQVRAHYENKARRLVSACGCAEGAFAALFLAIITGIIVAWYSSGLKLIAIIGLAASGTFVGFVVGAIAGKIAGLWLARWRLKNLVALLIAHAADTGDDKA